VGKKRPVGGRAARRGLKKAELRPLGELTSDGEDWPDQLQSDNLGWQVFITRRHRPKSERFLEFQLQLI
jgi:hypothetical protein